ncbi:MAG: hypothetical protein AAF065_13265 [Verrucomicrobiota bacterium]
MTEEPKLENNDAYQLAPGCPTFTADGGPNQRAFPYHSFTYGDYFQCSDRHQIDLYFGEDFVVNIYGHNLDELWGYFQMQEVRSVRCSTDSEKCEVRVTELKWSINETD